MSNEDKKLILSIQNIIDIIIEDKEFAIDCKRMNQLGEYLKDNEVLDENFINNYIDFIEMFNNFFEFLMSKIEQYEMDVIKYGEELECGYFTFNFNEFSTKDNLLVYQDMITYLENLFPNNILLQGLVFYMHINSLLTIRKFTNNKIKMSRGIPTIEIDYVARIMNFKEEYMKKVKIALQQGKRDSVFVDNEEWIAYAFKKINKIKNETNI